MASGPKNDTILGELIFRLRTEKGWSIRELGEKADVHYCVIQQLENGRIGEPSVVKIVKIARALKVKYGLLVDAACEDARNAEYFGEETPA